MNLPDLEKFLYKNDLQFCTFCVHGTWCVTLMTNEAKTVGRGKANNIEEALAEAIDNYEEEKT